MPHAHPLGIARWPRTVRIVAALLIIMAAAGCAVTDPGVAPASDNPQPTRDRFEYATIAMGSKCRVVLHAETEAIAAAAAAKAQAEIERLTAILSDYDDTSEAMRLVRGPVGVWQDASPDLIDVLQKSRTVWEASEGLFDPSLGSLTRLWRESMRSGLAPDPAHLATARAASSFEHVHIDAAAGRIRIGRAGLILDFGAIGKGYAADRALAVITGLGHPDALVELGGDLAVGAAPPGHSGWTVQTPGGPIEIAHAGVATSGPTFRFVDIGGVRYSHILDPRTGLGLTTPGTVTVTAPSGWLADALATAASVGGPACIASLTRAFPGASIRVHEGDPIPRP